MLEVLVNGNITEYLLWDISQVVGRAVVAEHSDYAEIKLINVSSFRRGEGLGTILLDRIISDFGHRDIVTSTFSSRVNWYERKGFTKRAERDSIVEMFREGSKNQSSLPFLIQ